MCHVKDYQHDHQNWPPLSRYFLFTGKSACFYSMDFLLNSKWKIRVLSMWKYFLIKTCFSVNITHSSKNFTWFVFLSHKRFDERPLFWHWARCFYVQPFWIDVKLFWDYFLTTNSKQCKVYIYGKRILKKYFSFFSKISLIYWINLTYIYIYIYIYTAFWNISLCPYHSLFRSPTGRLGL